MLVTHRVQRVNKKILVNRYIRYNIRYIRNEMLQMRKRRIGLQRVTEETVCLKQVLFN